jgi:hypothetical protein
MSKALLTRFIIALVAIAVFSPAGVSGISAKAMPQSDDRARSVIYGSDSPLFRYATQAIPSIHIIVKNGRAILKGIVDSKADAD